MSAGGEDKVMLNSEVTEPSMSTQSTHDGKRPRTAIIAVHGVGSHSPGATQNSVVDLLLSLPAERYADKRIYSAFRDIQIQMPLRPLHVTPADVERPKGLFSLYEEQSAKFAVRVKEHARKNSASPSSGEMGQQYTHMLLQDYKGGVDGNNYRTTRLEGERAASETTPRKSVHIYEVLWADLATPCSGTLTFFLAFFQLALASSQPQPISHRQRRW